MEMKKDNSSTGIRVFAALFFVGVVASVIDSVAYAVHIANHGIRVFSVVPLSVLWSYVITFPGNILTAFWLASWISAFAWLEIQGRGN